MIETQKSIADWALDTFGPVTSNLRIAIRAANEMQELLNVLAVNDNDRVRVAEEAADIMIVLARLLENLDIDLQAEVQAKMEINRARTWVKDGTGCGQHK